MTMIDAYVQKATSLSRTAGLQYPVSRLDGSWTLLYPSPGSAPEGVRVCHGQYPPKKVPIYLPRLSLNIGRLQNVCAKPERHSF